MPSPRAGLSPPQLGISWKLGLFWLVLFEVPRNVSGFPAMCLGIFSGGEKEEEGLVLPSVYSLGSGNRGLLWGFLQTFVYYY